jgi:hypothetical protein
MKNKTTAAVGSGGGGLAQMPVAVSFGGLGREATAKRHNVNSQNKATANRR